MNILVIDDEDLILSLVEHILQKDGHNVILASSGEEGFKLLTENKSNFDLVILDFCLPGLSGPETLRQMRAIRENLPCIFSSGEIVTKYNVPVDLRTNTYFLEKPYRSRELTDKIKEIFKIQVPLF